MGLSNTENRGSAGYHNPCLGRRYYHPAGDLVGCWLGPTMPIRGERRVINRVRNCLFHRFVSRSVDKALCRWLSRNGWITLR